MKKDKLDTGKYLLSMSNSVARFFFDILFYLAVVIAVIFCSRYAYSFCYQVFGSDAVSTTEDAIEIECLIQSGDSTREVAKKLERDGVIKDDLSFYVKCKVLNANIMPGTYILRTDMDYADILAIIAKFSAIDPEEEEAE